jgi:hypothetical protein
MLLVFLFFCFVCFGFLFLFFVVVDIWFWFGFISCILLFAFFNAPTLPQGQVRGPDRGQGPQGPAWQT